MTDAQLEAEAPERETPAFAHASEAEMGRILDFYEVRWEYEPVTFPILWNLDGEVIESFSPDFYLPDLDLFLEMTTLRQRLVRKKNRKLRRLRELYPDIRIKLFYARDFRAMLLKYGRFALVDSLSGTIGQMVPDRSAQLPAAIAVAAIDALPVPAVEAEAPVEIPSAALTTTSAERFVPSAPERQRRSGAGRRRRRRAAALASREASAAAATIAGPAEAAR